MTIAEYVLLAVSFTVTSFGLGLPVARRLLDDPLEQLCAAPAIGLTTAYLITFGLFTHYLPLGWFALAPLLGLGGLVAERKTLVLMWQDDYARRTMLGWVILAAWVQTLAMTIVNFNGGAWGGDWLEHHQRAIFFRDHIPLRTLFINEYLLPARPPLVNVVTAGFEKISVPRFVCDQVVLGLWSSLAFIPAALFYRKVGGTPGKLALLVGLFALNPAFLQNATFVWTKLPTAFYVLTGAHFLFRSLDEGSGLQNFFLAALALTAAVLTHYSAGPFCAILVFWWLAWRVYQGTFKQLPRECLCGLAVTIPLLGTWFGWSISHYGLSDTLLSNSTAMAGGKPEVFAQVGKIAGNLWASLIPHPFRTVDERLLVYTSALGWFRDYFFMIVQINIFGLLGTGGAVALAFAVRRSGGDKLATASPFRPAWVWSGVLACMVLGIAVHGAEDEWGLAHICLQPLGLLGLAVLAARFSSVGKAGLLLLGIGLLWDAVVNVGFHYWLQAQPPDPEWLAPQNLTSTFSQYGVSAVNARLKYGLGINFLGDTLSIRGLVLPLLVMLGAICLWGRSKSTPTLSQPSS